MSSQETPKDTQKELGNMYSITAIHIYHIIKNKRWKI